VAYNATLALAMQYLEWPASTTTHPTAVNAALMWAAVYQRMLTKLAACGVTVVASTGSEAIAKDIEAKLTSGTVGRANDLQVRGEVQPYTDWLLEDGETLLEELCGYDFAEAAGATVTRRGTRPRSMATDYPNDDLDTSDYQSPLASRKIDDDL